jgi:hypothetical protein
MPIVINGSGTVTGISATGISAQPAFPGNILQVVQATTSTSTAISSTSYTDTTLSASITPSSASNKILVIISQSGHVYSAQTAARTGSLQLVRDSTTIHQVIQALGGRGGLSSGSDRSVSASVSVTYLDSPSTTSSVTYKTQAKISVADSNYTLQIDSSPSTITLIEVAA